MQLKMHVTSFHTINIDSQACFKTTLPRGSEIHKYAFNAQRCSYNQTVGQGTAQRDTDLAKWGRHRETVSRVCDIQKNKEQSSADETNHLQHE